MAKLLKETSKIISGTLDIDLAITLSEVIPLDVHYESKNAFAYSMYISYENPEDSAKEKIVIATTITYVNINGKVVFYTATLKKTM